MGRTIPSFRIALEMQKEEWKPFRNALSKSEKKKFDEMWDIPRLYASACSNSVQLVPLHPIIMSILFHHYKELKECMLEVKHSENKVYTNYKELTMKEEEPYQSNEYKEFISRGDKTEIITKNRKITLWE
jgi:hypothetical protein